MMEMDLDFAPARVAMLRYHLDQATVVLLRGIKVGVNKWAAVMVPPAVHCFRIFTPPPLQPTLLLGTRNALVTVFRIDGRLEMIGHRDHKVHRFAHGRSQRAPNPAGQHFPAVCNFVPETHLWHQLVQALSRSTD